MLEAELLPNELFRIWRREDPFQFCDALLRRWDVFLREGRAFAEEELLHLLNEELLGLGSPRLKPVFVEEHFLVVDPLAPRRLGDILVDFLSEFRVERGLVEALHLLFVTNTKYCMRHFPAPSFHCMG